MTLTALQPRRPNEMEEQVMKIMLASNHEQRLAQLAMGLWTMANCELHKADRGSDVLAALARRPMDLVVIDHQLLDQSGLDLAGEIARYHPFVDCVMVDSAAPEAFHEKTEGLGILLQLPSPPEMADATLIISHLMAIKRLAEGGQGAEGRGQ